MIKIIVAFRILFFDGIPDERQTIELVPDFRCGFKPTEQGKAAHNRPT